MSAESMPLLYLLAAVGRRIACAVVGHWWDVEPAIEHRGDIFGPYRVCARCELGDTRLVLATEPPPGHPDSMTRELSPRFEVELARIDAELFPEEAH
ncbi:hypothetical protein [Thermomonospora umbrina]|uniref:Uncharacterized protein n=1 Tax=Thermomonospora umbrina TaxID=111806 RepID=A0A3D9SXR0_9ACTN|nr:hypothetical protein [Thermomonospora umbrina]REF00348.1 hypothetical protein DFJ69_5880 [Thermomonospora umbrina]